MVINGFVSVVISTIEKRFDLASRESGFIASGYDIASVICLIPVSYFGGVGHRPRWIAAGVLLLSLGSFLFVMPHFVTDFYTYDELATSDQTTCDWQLTATGENASEAEVAAAATKPPGRATSNLSRYMYIMVLAQMLHGAGGTPIYTLAVTYLNEGLKPKVAPMYLGRHLPLCIYIYVCGSAMPRGLFCRLGLLPVGLYVNRDAIRKLVLTRGPLTHSL